MEKFQKILRGSKQYQFEETVLTITSYYTGEEIKLDLGAMDEEMLEQLLVVEDEEDFEDDYFEN